MLISVQDLESIGVVEKIVKIKKCSSRHAVKSVNTLQIVKGVKATKKFPS